MYIAQQMLSKEIHSNSAENNSSHDTVKATFAEAGSDEE